MQINLVPDSSIASAPAGLTAAVEAAANVFDQDFPGNYTVNISYGWGTYDNVADATLTNPNSGVSPSAVSATPLYVNYSQLKSWLTADAIWPDQNTAVGSLPASNTAFPGGANTFIVSTAEEKALGVFVGDGGALDGSIKFDRSSSSASYWEPAALCEITHALGWTTASSDGGVPGVADLFRYSSTGNYQWTSGKPAYFSIDGGTTDLADFATSFDYTLFPNLPENDPLRYPFYSSATSLTNLDIEALNAIGFGSAPALPPSIDLLNFEASFPDLIAAFGINQSAMQNWYDTYQPVERRIETFDGLDYVASYTDLINAFGSAGSKQAVQDGGASHFITNGHNEGRTKTFDGLDYIASYRDLIHAFGANSDAGAYHYIEYGYNEGRTVTFDGLDYVASYPDLIKAFGSAGSEQAVEDEGASHFITSGVNEGRTTSFRRTRLYCKLWRSDKSVRCQ